MQAYILKRILLFVPTLFVISILSFFLSKMTPGDPVQALMQGRDDANIEKSEAEERRRYQKISEQLNLDKPIFYFSLTPSSYPDTIYKITPKSERENCKNWILANGNWPAIQEFRNQLKSTAASNPNKASRNLLQSILINQDYESILPRLQNYTQEKLQSSEEVSLFENLIVSFQRLEKQATKSKNWHPSFNWFGFNNQYHHWLKNILSGNFGISYADSRPATKKIMESLKWSLSINLLAAFLAFLFAIPLGVFQAERKDSRIDKWISSLSYLFYSIPIFWLATLLIVFFTTKEYGSFFNWFPTVGVFTMDADLSFWQKWIKYFSKLILPILCLVLVSLAVIVKQMRNGILSELKEKYMLTAKSKGLNKKNAIRKHAFINALFPMVTILATVLPASLAGSIIIEVIFNIPGMGRLMFDSILSKDWPVVYAILLVVAFVTLVSYLLADILYAWLNPKVKLANKE